MASSGCARVGEDMTDPVPDPLTHRPTVAVIIPAYQCEATLGATLASVAAQSVQPAEVVVGDDGSTDSTIAVARSWEGKLPLRVVQTTQNLGPAGARHAAILASSSEMVALVDADDICFPDHLESMLAAHAQTDDGLASADVFRWIPGRAIGARPLSAASPLPPPGAQLAWLLKADYLSIASLFSRRRYDEVGGFRTQFHEGEDWDLWIRMVRAGATVVRPPQPTLLYRLSEGSVSSSEAAAQAHLRMLRVTADEAGDDISNDERRASRTGLRLTRAACNLQASYVAAAAGQPLAARILGARAVLGIRPVAIRGLAMALAPRAVARRRLAVRYEPDVWLRRFGPGGS